MGDLKDVPEILIKQIDVGKSNVRTLDRDEKIDELADSIKKYGLLQPILVFQEGERFNLIIGQRRLLAFKKLGRIKIPALVLSKKPDEERAKIMSLSENIQRVELNRADIVEVVGFLIDKYKSVKTVAKLLGVTPPTIYSYQRIKDAPTEVKQLLCDRKIRKEDVKRVMMIAPDDKEKMVKLAREIGKLTTDEKRRLVDAGLRMPKAQPKELIEDAKKPHILEKVVVQLTPALLKALDTAVKQVALSREEIAKNALVEWLTNKGYYKE